MKFRDVDAALAGTRFMTTKQGRAAYKFIVKHKLGRILELGFAHGKSTCYFAAAAEEVGGDAQVLTLDRASARTSKPNIFELLDRCQLTDLVTPIFAERSYTWELMKLLEMQPQPRFDFAYIDGGHTWDVTGYGFLLVDRLLAPGGWVVFDDLDWTLDRSRTMKDIPRIKELPEEERTTPQVRKVFELLVRTQPGYVEAYERDGWGWARKSPTA